MKDLINQVVEYLAGFSVEQWIWIAVAGLILIYLIYNRKQYVNQKTLTYWLSLSLVATMMNL